ncbi:hypothetical protein BK120_27200 [Paenibacillus sp. FSL A5-0031]|uniref:hypothetical protein n=1 Tax=Paenibacillus sp. FSL A5-0031 TaxID=1920420 RepID=UPI00096D06B0|nr:hypothetical protein [Paenibacillus sp. FSL A5-0031]OME77215.1 hypothetical protein BK120_27200 [Paenibacillus sp. FSL A5-0031]
MKKYAPWYDVIGSKLLASRIQTNQGDYKINERINQITSSTLIVGVDITKFKHVTRAQDYPGASSE